MDTFFFFYTNKSACVRTFGSGMITGDRWVYLRTRPRGSSSVSKVVGQLDSSLVVKETVKVEAAEEEEEPEQKGGGD